HFTPVLKGSKRGGVFSVILGAALMVASIFVPGAGLFGMGAALALGGVAQLLTPQPKMPAINEKEKKQSTSFSNLSNMAAQGRMVPLAYGRIRCGSLVISQGVQTLDVNIVE
ncbi:tail assembly protein, partial [Pasteurella multocida]|nr:tail assembly protein [Pasteurella multocida]